MKKATILISTLVLGAPFLLGTVVTFQTAEVHEIAVPVHPDRTLTVVFPGPLSAVSGAGFTPDPESISGEFLLAYTPGANHLSIAPLPEAVKEDAPMRNLNIYFKGGLYVLFPLPVDSPEKAWVGLRFVETPPPSPLGPAAPEVSVGRTLAPPQRERVYPSSARLIGLIDTAKMFMGLDRETLRAALLRMPHLTVAIFPVKPLSRESVVVRPLMAIRHEQMESVVYVFELKNMSPTAIIMAPESISIRLAGSVFPASVSDGPRVLEPGSAHLFYSVVDRDSRGLPNRTAVDQPFVPLFNDPKLRQ